MSTVPKNAFNIGAFIFSLIVAPFAAADVTPFNYQLGRLMVSEEEHRIVIHAARPVTVAVQPGGHTWPRLSLDDAHRIYAGNIVIDATTGKSVTRKQATLALPHGVDVTVAARGYRFRRAGKSCDLSLPQLGLDPRRSALEALKYDNIAFSSSAGALLALTSQFGQDGRVENYLIEQIDIDRCKITVHKSIGNPDLLVELGHSEHGGWWITGSIEQTLLQSNDGRNWRQTTLPAGLSSLVSSYVTNTREIWLAAILVTDGTESPYLLVYSGDAGQHWRNVMADDPVLARLPAGWLEGQKRRTPQ